MFEQLGSLLGQTNTQQPRNTINYGQVLKTLGLSGMNNKDQVDMKDAGDVMSILSMFGGGIGGAGAAASGVGGNTMMNSFGNTMMQ